MIIFDSVTKKFGHKKALDDVSFEIDGGEFVSIVGPSGAGKSTLIHALIGASRLEHGKIIVDRLDISSLSPAAIQGYRRNIGIVFQDYKLLPRRTIYENVAFALEVCGYPKKLVNERTTAVLKLTGLEDKRNDFPHELSGGERQRAAVARALVHDPDLLIADEPTGNLDRESSMDLAKLFQKINKAGTTVILATHNHEVVNTIKERVITLKDGKITSDRKNATYA